MEKKGLKSLIFCTSILVFFLLVPFVAHADACFRPAFGSCYDASSAQACSATGMVFYSGQTIPQVAACELTGCCCYSENGNRQSFATVSANACFNILSSANFTAITGGLGFDLADVGDKCAEVCEQVGALQTNVVGSNSTTTTLNLTPIGMSENTQVTIQTFDDCHSTITGTVTSTFGLPEGLLVYSQNNARSSTSWGIVQSNGGTTGTFVIDGVCAGSNVISATDSTDQFTSDSKTRNALQDQTVSDVVLTLTPTRLGTITGTVVNADTDAKLSNIFVRVRGTPYAATTDAGKFTITIPNIDASSKQYTLLASSSATAPTKFISTSKIVTLSGDISTVTTTISMTPQTCFGTQAPSSLDAINVKGEPEITLTWAMTACEDEVNSYVVYRCDGKESACSDEESFLPVGYPTSKSFTDTTLDWDADYTYVVGAVYAEQLVELSTDVSINTGNIACAGVSTTSKFCGTEQKNNAFVDSIQFCDAENKFDSDVCPAATPVCVIGFETITQKSAKCIAPNPCAQSTTTNPFGLYATQLNCINQQSGGVCYIDKATSNVDSCLNCKQGMTCSDYKSQSACASDASSCNVGSCAWETIDPLFGIGVCKSTKAPSCGDCTNASKSPFGVCDARTCAAYGTSADGCFFKSTETTTACQACSATQCSEYTSLTSCEGSPAKSTGLDSKTNAFTSRSEDACNIDVCRWKVDPDQPAGGACIKDADANTVDDCTGGTMDLVKCNLDRTPPTTFVVMPTVSNPAISNFSIRFIPQDKGATGSQQVYSTQFCITSEAMKDSECQVAKNFAVAQRSGKTGIYLNVIDGQISLPADVEYGIPAYPPYQFSTAEGVHKYYLKYFSIDRAKNVEEVVTKEFIVNNVKPQITLHVEQFVAPGQKTKTDIIASVESDTPVRCLITVTAPDETTNAPDAFTSSTPKAYSLFHEYSFERSDGIYAVKATCRDVTGNSNFKIEEVITSADPRIQNVKPTGVVGTSAPTVTLQTTLPVLCKMTNDQSKLSNLLGADAAFASLEVQLNPVGGRGANDLYNYSAALTGLTEGTHTYYIMCNFDPYSFDIASFTVDTQPATINFESAIAKTPFDFSIWHQNPVLYVSCSKQNSYQLPCSSIEYCTAPVNFNNLQAQPPVCNFTNTPLTITAGSPRKEITIDNTDDYSMVVCARTVESLGGTPRVGDAVCKTLLIDKINPILFSPPLPSVVGVNQIPLIGAAFDPILINKAIDFPDTKGTTTSTFYAAKIATTNLFINGTMKLESSPSQRSYAQIILRNGSVSPVTVQLDMRNAPATPTLSIIDSNQQTLATIAAVGVQSNVAVVWSVLLNATSLNATVGNVSIVATVSAGGPGTVTFRAFNLDAGNNNEPEITVAKVSLVDLDLARLYPPNLLVRVNGGLDERSSLTPIIPHGPFASAVSLDDPASLADGREYQLTVVVRDQSNRTSNAKEGTIIFSKDGPKILNITFTTTNRSQTDKTYIEFRQNASARVNATSPYGLLEGYASVFASDVLLTQQKLSKVTEYGVNGTFETVLLPTGRLDVLVNVTDTVGTMTSKLFPQSLWIRNLQNPYQCIMLANECTVGTAAMTCVGNGNDCGGACIGPQSKLLLNNTDSLYYEYEAVAYGSECTSQVRECLNGVISGSFAAESCKVAAADSCISPDGKEIVNGDKKKYYESRYVEYGTTCREELRTCNNGNLNGTFESTACEVLDPKKCVDPSDSTKKISHGASVTRYEAEAVPYGTTCSSESRSCTNGDLSGSFTSSTCHVAAADSCIGPDGKEIVNNARKTYYALRYIEVGETCVSESRVCSNGVLSGTNQFAKCEPRIPVACIDPYTGKSIAHGASVTHYESRVVPFGQTCDGQTQSCSNGVLSPVGTFTEELCHVAAKDSCVGPDKVELVNGATKTYFKTVSVPTGQSCESQERTCTDGDLSGTYTKASCVVLPESACLGPDGTILATQTQKKYYQTPYMQFGQPCIGESRVCTQTVLSGSYTYPTCRSADDPNSGYGGDKNVVITFPVANITDTNCSARYTAADGEVYTDLFKASADPNVNNLTVVLSQPLLSSEDEVIDTPIYIVCHSNAKPSDSWSHVLHVYTDAKYPVVAFSLTQADKLVQTAYNRTNKEYVSYSGGIYTAKIISDKPVACRLAEMPYGAVTQPALVDSFFDALGTSSELNATNGRTYATSYEVPITLVDGKKLTYAVSCIDKVGNVAKVVRFISINTDSQAPPYIISVEPQLITSIAQPTKLRVTTAVPSDCSVELPGTESPILLTVDSAIDTTGTSQRTYLADISFSSQGTVVANVSCTNGLISTQRISFIVDTVAPSITFEPGQNTTIYTQSPIVSLNIVASESAVITLVDGEEVSFAKTVPAGAHTLDIPVSVGVTDGLLVIIDAVGNFNMYPLQIRRAALGYVSDFVDLSANSVRNSVHSFAGDDIFVASLSSVTGFVPLNASAVISAQLSSIVSADNLSSIKPTAIVSVDAVSTPKGALLNFTLPANLEDGSYLLSYVVRWNNSVVAADSTVFVIDALAEQINSRHLFSQIRNNTRAISLNLSVPYQNLITQEVSMWNSLGNVVSRVYAKASAQLTISTQRSYSNFMYAIVNELGHVASVSSKVIHDVTAPFNSVRFTLDTQNTAASGSVPTSSSPVPAFILDFTAEPMRIVSMHIVKGTATYAVAGVNTQNQQFYDSVQLRSLERLADGSYTLVVTLADVYGNFVSKQEFDFKVKASTLKIIMESPPFGLTNSSSLPLVISTDRPALCAYSLADSNDAKSLSTMNPFTQANGFVHRVSVPFTDNIPQYFANYLVSCLENGTVSPVVNATFKLGRNVIPPKIESVVIPTVQNGVLVNAAYADLVVTTDTPAICRYASVASTEVSAVVDYTAMTAFENSSVLLVTNKQALSDLHSGQNYTYVVMCDNGAGVTSTPQSISFTVDANQQGLIVLESPVDGGSYQSTTVPIKFSVAYPVAQGCVYATSQDGLTSSPLPATRSTTNNLKYSATPSASLFKYGSNDLYIRCLFATSNNTLYPEEMHVQFVVDATAPDKGYIKVANVTTKLDRINAEFVFKDNESGIALYEYAVGTAPYGQSGWNATKKVSSSTASRVTISGLKLTDGETYYVSALAKNGAGKPSIWVSSNKTVVDVNGNDADENTIIPVAPTTTVDLPSGTTLTYANGTRVTLTNGTKIIVPSTIASQFKAGSVVTLPAGTILVSPTGVRTTLPANARVTLPDAVVTTTVVTPPKSTTNISTTNKNTTTTTKRNTTAKPTTPPIDGPGAFGAGLLLFLLTLGLVGGGAGYFFYARKQQSRSVNRMATSGGSRDSAYEDVVVPTGPLTVNDKLKLALQSRIRKQKGAQLPGKATSLFSAFDADTKSNRSADSTFTPRIGVTKVRASSDADAIASDAPTRTSPMPSMSSAEIDKTLMRTQESLAKLKDIAGKQKPMSQLRRSQSRTGLNGSQSTNAGSALTRLRALRRK